MSGSECVKKQPAQQHEATTKHRCLNTSP